MVLLIRMARTLRPPNPNHQSQLQIAISLDTALPLERGANLTSQ